MILSPEQEGGGEGQRYVQALTQGGEKGGEIGERQKRQEKAREGEGILDERNKGEKIEGTGRKVNREERVIIASDSNMT